MPVFSRYGKVVLFRHVPKTGGTTLNQLVSKISSVKVSLYDPGHKEERVFGISPQHFDNRHLSELFPDMNIFHLDFMIVRNPLERLKSEWRSRQLRNAGSRQPFASWVAESLEKAEKNLETDDNHFQPMISFLGSNTQVFRLEDGLERPLKRLFRTLGFLRYRVDKRNTTSQYFEDVACSDDLKRAVQVWYREDYEYFSY